MAQSYEFFGKDGQTAAASFEEYRTKGGELCCAANYIEGGAMRPLTHGQFDATMDGFNRLRHDDQMTLRKVARWAAMDDGARAKNPAMEPMKDLSDDRKKDYHAALERAGLDHSDRHLSVIRDDGASRHKKVFDVGGLPVFEDNMTPKNISNALGRQTYGDANRQEQKTGLSVPKPLPAARL